MLNNFIKRLNLRKIKNITYIICILVVIVWFVYRFIVVFAERNLSVCNLSRVYTTDGIPVETIKVNTKTDYIYEPIFIKNNRALVAGNKIHKLYVGQNIDNCKISYVSANIDIDTGAFIVRTNGCDDGLHNIQFKHTGFFIPMSAIKNNSVIVIQNNVTIEKSIVIKDSDIQNAVVDGLNENDIVVLSSVKENQKVKIIKE